MDQKPILAGICGSVVSWPLVVSVGPHRCAGVAGMTNKLASAILAGMKAREEAFEKSYVLHAGVFAVSQNSTEARMSADIAAQNALILFRASQAEREAFEQAMEEE